MMGYLSILASGLAVTKVLKIKLLMKNDEYIIKADIIVL